MNPKLRHLDAVVAKTLAEKKLIRVSGGIEGAPLVRVDCAGFTLIGPMGDLPIEDPSTQSPASAPAQAPSKVDPHPHTGEETRRVRNAAQAFVDCVSDLRRAMESTPRSPAGRHRR